MRRLSIWYKRKQKLPVRHIEHFVHFVYYLSMQTVSATYAKQNFAAVLDLSQREPVQIRRHERDIAVVISDEEYESLRRLRVQELIRLI